MTARDRRFGEPPMSLPAQLQGPSGGHARARKSGLKLAIMLGSAADAQPPSRHVNDSVSVRASNGLTDTLELSRTSELSQTQQTRQSELDAWLVSASPQARAAQSSEDDPSALEPGSFLPPSQISSPLSPPRALTSTPRANLPRIPIRRPLTVITVSQWP